MQFSTLVRGALSVSAFISTISAFSNLTGTARRHTSFISCNLSHHPSRQTTTTTTHSIASSQKYSLHLTTIQPPPSPPAGGTRDLFLRQLLEESVDYGNFRNHISEPNDKLKVGIIGAGAAGLYAAILLDSLQIDYEILESSDRIGGRILTHRFNQTAWDASKPGQPDYYDYYDAGAMRFPGMAWMDRVIGKTNISLVSYINSKLKPEHPPIKMIPYIYQANDTFRLFNDKLVYNQITPSADTFDILVSQGGTINNTAFAALSPNIVFDDAVSEIVEALKVDFTAGFNKLMQYDNLSVRQYLLGKGYSTQEIDWLETVNEATTHRTMGGMDRLVDGMVKIIHKSVETKKRATAIKPAGKSGLTVIINGAEKRMYDHVINTAPLGAIQVMDMTELQLDYRKKHAIRRLQYDPSVKMGMKFKTRWWENLTSGSFRGGQSFSDLPIRRCVYPSYGLGIPGAPGTMIASYTCGQDSARLGAYFNQDEARKHIIEVTLRDLAAMHNVTYEFLHSQYVDSHLWDWYDGEDAVGAFAKCGPGEYTTLMPTLMTPAANGRLHFGGEALSSGHAWIVGAVNSAYRTVAEVLAVEGMHDKLVSMVDTWGSIDEVDMGWYSHVFVK